MAERPDDKAMRGPRERDRKTPPPPSSRRSAAAARDAKPEHAAAPAPRDSSSGTT